ncbi:MAG TPA: chemoreceptor glutamine deamidase CheD [Rhodocyclaceae bacterium]|nr:chemoreceptor glutamine deamidase CheD [Rhodocyclaceae bacterium]HNH36301.1 chemoreceptor glutamine deamidase CheD [Rhodocyclaceae bacterium]
MNDELGFVEHLAGNRYFDKSFELEAVKVLPGEYFVSTTSMMMVTVLGSCVSACIRDREKGIGGMNHFMLADSGDGGALSASARYGTYAMEVLINHLIKLGARRGQLEAKVFGGGRVMASLASSNVGERNSDFVMRYLGVEGIQVAASDLLGNFPRKIYFFPATGRVLVKKLVRMHNDTLIKREKEYAARLTEAPVAGDVELFG